MHLRQTLCSCDQTKPLNSDRVNPRMCTSGPACTHPGDVTQFDEQIELQRLSSGSQNTKAACKGGGGGGEGRGGALELAFLMSEVEFFTRHSRRMLGFIPVSLCIILEDNLECIMCSCSVVTNHVVLWQFNVNVSVLHRFSH